MEFKRLGDICKLRNGRAFKPDEWSDKGLPIIRIQNLNDVGKPFNYCDFEIDEKFVVNNGDLLFSWSGTPGTSFGAFIWGRGKGYLNQHIFRVDVDNEIVDRNYLKYALNNQLINIIDQAHGGVGLQHITKAKLDEIQIGLPSLQEQCRIVSILDKADDIRQKRQQAIAKLDELLQATFIDMFGDPVSNPKNWPVIQVSEVCSEIVDCVNKTAPIVDYETPYKMIRTTNVRNYKVDVSSVRYVEKNVFDIWNRRLTPQRGDVILTREAPVGEVGILESDDNIFLGQRLMLYRANLEKITPEYLLFFLMSENLKRQYEQVSSGSTVKHLSVVDCKKWEINLPPIHIQREFSNFYQKVRVIDAGKFELSEKTEQLFSSLQQKAFNGTL